VKPSFVGRGGCTATDSSIAMTDGSHRTSYVPQGVNAASWMGFEQRIQERRFQGLLRTIDAAIAAGDVAGARVALQEARELRPGAPELLEIQTRIARLFWTPAPVPKPADARMWSRTFGAVAWLVIGISLLVGLEWLRPTVRVSPPAEPSIPAAAPNTDPRIAVTPDVPENPEPPPADERPVAAFDARPDSSAAPRATSGIARPMTRAVNAIDRRVVGEPNRVPLEARSIPTGEIPDDYVVAPIRSPISLPNPAPARGAAPAPPITAPVTSSPVAAAPEPVTTTNAGSTANAAVVNTRLDQVRVEDVLRRYAQAYAQLDAVAAHQVWPSVDERALARAFQGLESQDVSFDACDIEIRGVTANASCRGQARYTGKVGAREPHTESRLWRFALRRDGEEWKIENAEARRTSSGRVSDSK
jgi:hypothetical protein